MGDFLATVVLYGALGLIFLASFLFCGEGMRKAYPFFCPAPPLLFLYGIYFSTKGFGLGATAYLFWILVSWIVSAVISIPGLVLWSAEVEPQRKKRLLVALLIASSPITISGLYIAAWAPILFIRG